MFSRTDSSERIVKIISNWRLPVMKQEQHYKEERARLQAVATRLS